MTLQTTTVAAIRLDCSFPQEGLWKRGCVKIHMIGTHLCARGGTKKKTTGECVRGEQEQRNKRVAGTGVSFWRKAQETEES